MRVLGIDEAGYGPVLGPLVVAGVTLELDGDRYDAAGVWAAVGRDAGIDDSKAVLSHRSMARGEETVSAFLAAAGVAATTRRELLDALLLAPPDLVSPWGAGSAEASPFDGAPCLDARGPLPPCTPDDAPLPRWGPAPPTAERVADVAARLAAAGVRIAAVRAVALCPGRLNHAVAAGVSKGLVDYRLFARLLAAEGETTRGELHALCGKLGGRSRYGELLGDLGPTMSLEEGSARSAYRVAGLGQVEFLRSAESQHLAVAMASMVAKLTREHVLDQWHALLAASVDAPHLETCSGYRDPVTRSYIEATAEARRALGVPRRCFIRER